MPGSLANWLIKLFIDEGILDIKKILILLSYIDVEKNTLVFHPLFAFGN